MHVIPYHDQIMTTEEQEYFWLKTVSKGEGGNEDFSNLFLRLIGSGSDFVVATPSPPKFLRTHFSKDHQPGKVIFTSSAPQHKGRKWYLTLTEKLDSKEGIDLTKINRPKWCPVSIREVEEDDEESDKFEFVLKDDDNDKQQQTKVLSSTFTDFNGFVICQWNFGHPQLFWLTESFKEGELPLFMQKVDLIWSPYIVQSS